MSCSLSAFVLRLLNLALLIVGLVLCATPFVRYASLCDVSASQLKTVNGFWVLACLGAGLVIFSILGCCAASGRAKYRRPYILLLLLLVGGSAAAYFWQNAQGAIHAKVDDLTTKWMANAFDDFGTLYHAGQCQIDHGGSKAAHCAKCHDLEKVLDDCIDPTPGTPAATFVQQCIVSQFVKFPPSHDCDADCVHEFCTCEATGVFALGSVMRYLKIGLLCLGGFFVALLVLVLCVKQEREMSELRGRLVQPQGAPLPY